MVEELFAQTIVAAWKGWHKFENKSSYFTWVCRIALNKIADYYRQEVNIHSKLIAPLIESLADPNTASLEETMALDELKLSVSRCLDLLPAEAKQVLFLRYWKEKTYQEIGKILQVSPKAVESKLYRARKTFARVVARHGLERI